jgi:hypothetical protein
MTATATRPAPPASDGERFARQVVTWCGVLVGLACFGFSFGNVLALGRHLTVPGYVAWLVAPAVDLTVVGLIVGIRHLSLRGVAGRRLRPARLLLIAAGLATLALNTAHGLFVRHHLGVVAYDSLAPLLLIGWAEVGPWFLRQFTTTASDTSTSAPASTEPAGPAGAVGGPPPVGKGRAPARPIPAADEAAAVVSGPGQVPANSGTTRQPMAPSPTVASARSGRPGPGRPDRAELVEQARAVAAAHLAEHGRPISRDALRRVLRVSNQVASHLLREVNAGPAPALPVPGHDGTGTGRPQVLAVPAMSLPAGPGSPDQDGRRG